jgi:hypothetical protein
VQRTSPWGRRLSGRGLGALRQNARAICSLIAAAAAIALAVAPGAASAFSFQSGEAGFQASVLAKGAAATLAGSHPHVLTYRLAFDEGDLRNVSLQAPPGLAENQTAIEDCSQAEFHTHRTSPYEASQSGESCLQESQVGVVRVTKEGGSSRDFGLFNLTPPEGVPAELGFAPFGQHVLLDSHVGAAEGEYALSLSAKDIPQSLEVIGLEVSIWGVPWAAVNDSQRGNCLNEAEPEVGWAKCSVGEPSNVFPFAYLTLPSSCEGALGFGVRASSWQGGGEVSAQALNRDTGGNSAPQEGCDSLAFEPQPNGFLTDTKASSASGYNFRLKVNYEGLLLPRLRAPAQSKEVHLTLPTGVTINPSVGAGLGVCTPGQYASETDHWTQESGCPATSKIGDFRLHSPLYREWIAGGIYLAQADDPRTSAHGAENPFDSLIAVYLIAKSPERGILVKVAGQIDPDPTTGSLSASFQTLPQLPYTDLEVNFRSGQRAPMITPPFCGAARSQIELGAWAAGLKPLSAHTDSAIETGIERGPCPTGATPPFKPEAVAGGVNSNVNSYTPYFVHLTRRDTEQEITSYSLDLPKGIVGKLAGIPFCPDAAIAAARVNRGVAETTNPSCPAASQVGRTLTGYGVGAALTYAEGRIYLAGPYNGAPLSLVTINPATVGPFDLGTVVVRSAFDVDPLSAQLQIDSSASDRIPHIIDGIPLHLRDVRVYIDRQEFTHNPSSCEPSNLVSTLTGSGASFASSADDSTAKIEKHFQLLNCLTLGFKPDLGLALKGATKRGGFPALRATFEARGPQDSNLKRIEVDMPHQLFLAQNHIRKVCTRVQFNDDQCPADSIYGTAVAFTPLLDEPLRGNVYLRSSDNKLPDLVTQLHSGAIEIDLEGKIGPSKRGGIQAFFDNLPDAPLDRFVMNLGGGKRGLLTNSVDVCAAPPFATVAAVAQNNRGAAFRSLLHSSSCRKRARAKQGHGHKMGERGHRHNQRARVSVAQRSER